MGAEEEYAWKGELMMDERRLEIERMRRGAYISTKSCG